MDKYTATEQAFKHGYEKGYEAAKAEIVHCKECTRGKIDTLYGSVLYHCLGGYGYNKADHFCSYGEKIENPNISKQTADALKKMGEKAHGG